MVFDITTLSVQELPEEVEETIPDPSISTEVAEDEYGKFVIEPLEPGYGVTIGNPMRRILYNGLEGTARPLGSRVCSTNTRPCRTSGSR